MSERLNGNHASGKTAHRDSMSMRSHVEDGNARRPQSYSGSGDSVVSNAQEACNRLELQLREAAHRCSNDLQLVVGLLYLQAKRLKDRDARAALEDAAGRIAVVARAREASAGAAHSELATALRQVCEALHAHAELRSILISLEIGDGCDGVASARVMPIGMAVNELATNAIKHAFDSDSGGKITIRVRRRGEDVVVQVDDDGVAFPDTPPAAGHGLGLSLIRRLISSCGGEFRQPSPGSKRFEIIVPRG